MNQASAFGSYETPVSDYCTSKNYELQPDYAANTCSSCHSSEGTAAYNSQNYEYFCPAPVVQDPICTDGDSDGFFAEGNVCGTLADFNDNNDSAYPGAAEDCTDGVDNDGDGLVDGADGDAVNCPVICTDGDDDGFFVEGEVCGTLADFNDNNDSAYPGAVEDCTDGVDNDGDGLLDGADPDAVGCAVLCTDMDGDGYSTEGGSCGPVDCDDQNDAVNPGATEVCSDNIDNNCNGQVDTADMNAVNCPVFCTDSDGDGYSTEGGSCGAMDCDDNNPAINPGALEVCDDGVDNNCNNRSDSVDSVCQSSGGNDDQDEMPWWRDRSDHKRDRSHKDNDARERDDDGRHSSRDRNEERDDDDRYSSRDRNEVRDDDGRSSYWSPRKERDDD